MTFDEARAAHPRFSFAVYAYEPGGPVMLEVIDGAEIFVFEAPTLQAALDRAFPPRPEPDPPAAPAANVFD